MKPYYSDELVTIYHGNCRDVLPSLSNCADLCVTDPPYFFPAQTYVQARGTKYRRMLGELSILAGYFEDVFSLVASALKMGGNMYVFCDAKSYPIVHDALFPHAAHVRLLIWDKVVSFNGYTWRHQHELIAWAECAGAKRVPTGDGDIIECRGVEQEGRHHPAEKPEALLARLIGKHEAQTVIDPFMGSGVSVVSAKRLGRKAIGIELEEKYCEIAANRCSQGCLAEMFA